MIYVFAYLLAAILANLSSAYFGPGASIVNAFLFIGLDLTSRDKLHDQWQGKGLVWKMFLLFSAGSLLSYAINHQSGQIAFASFIAFFVSATIDTISYKMLQFYGRAVKVNGSNILSAAADSLVFPTLAFGKFIPIIAIGQFAVKILGGFIWYVIIERLIHDKTR